jgi:hypothetical protein
MFRTLWRQYDNVTYRWVDWLKTQLSDTAWLKTQLPDTATIVSDDLIFYCTIEFATEEDMNWFILRWS